MLWGCAKSYPPEIDVSNLLCSNITYYYYFIILSSLRYFNLYCDRYER
jgi:hypothetical protein